MSLTKIVGHNILKFDLPYLIRSSIINGVKVPSYLSPFDRKRTSYDPIFQDTMHLYGAAEYGYLIKLETLAKSLGFKGGKTGSGKNFYKMSQDKKEEYLTADLRMTEHVWQRLNNSLSVSDDAIIFDIETAPRTEEEIEQIAPAFDENSVLVGNLKDPEKIQQKIEKAEVNHISNLVNKAALHAHYSQPCAIGYIHLDGKVQLDFSEPKELLEQFWDTTAKVWGHAKEQILNY